MARPGEKGVSRLRCVCQVLLVDEERPDGTVAPGGLCPECDECYQVNVVRALYRRGKAPFVPWYYGETPGVE